jgi:hypothetical protein
VLRENASAVLWGNASAELWENARAVLYNFSVVWKNIKAKVSITKKSKHAHIVVTQDQNWFERNGIEKTKSLTLYKKVSKDFKTQENTPNETCWSIGSIVKHQDWNPKEQECGGGKFHACSRPYFCDEFRNEIGDRYIAIRVALLDVYAWEDHPSYPYKIGFRKGKVLYECDRFGEKITEDGKIEVKK